ncbi:MAG: lytic murein transglycosylase [Thermodesulfobacteriota bacterium]
MSLAAAAAAAARPDKVFAPLRDLLLTQGLSQAEVDRLLAAPQLKFEDALMARMLSVPESRLNYNQFLSKQAVQSARHFMVRHAELLKETQRRTGVPVTVVVAILTVESRLGAYTGKHRVLNMLASQAVLDTPAAQARLARRWPAKRRHQLQEEATQQRLTRRARWARQEIVALLRLAQQQKVSPWQYRGSLAGALGMAQFMPSSALAYGVDGDADGVLNLDRPADAIHSVANYLQKHGWRPGISRKAQLRVILTYNRSDPYARTVLELARRLS